MAGGQKLSFSFSRHGTFTSCPRQYYLNYYGGVNGWFKNSPKENQETYFLKKLQGIYAWAGTVAHDIIEEALKLYRDRGEVKSKEEWIKRARDRLKKDYVTSQKRVKAHKDGDFYAYKMFGLKEHEYGEHIPKDLRQKIRDRVDTCLTNFFTSEIYQKILNSDTKKWKSIEEFSTYTIPLPTGYKLPVFSVPDFAMLDGNTLHIYDWKSGKPKASYKEQLSLYAIYAERFWGVSVDQVRADIFYLLSNSVTPVTITAEVLDTMKTKIETGAMEMIEFLENKDPVKNNAIAKENFPLTTNRFNCKWCNFERVCGILDV